MADNNAFHNPKDFGTFDLAIAQQNQLMLFSWDSVVVPECKVNMIYCGKVIKTYTEGDGLTRSNGNQDVTLQLNGADFDGYEGKEIDAECNFFFAGSVEVIFKLKVLKTSL